MAPHVEMQQGLVDFVSVQHDTYPYIAASNADLRGKSVLITGASRGIGLTTAAHFAKVGCPKIALAARSSLVEAEAAVKKAAAEANHPVPQIMTLQLDVTSADAVRAAAEEVEKAFGGSLDVLINNAGYLETWKNIGDSDPNEWWKTFEVNINGTYLPCRFFLPLLLKSELKTVINVSSIGGHVVFPSSSAYHVTKFAIFRLTEYLHAENREYGLVTYALHPGAVVTELALGLPEEMHFNLVDTPELPADVMVWLSQERRDWLSGRYVSANWDMEELVSRKEEIVDKDLLKFKCTLA